MQSKRGFKAFVNINEDRFIFATALTPVNKHNIKKSTNWTNENNLKDHV
jgi:hypothetical protein